MPTSNYTLITLHQIFLYSLFLLHCRSGERHALIDAAVDASLIVPKTYEPNPGNLLGGLSDGYMILYLKINLTCRCQAV